MGEEQLLNEEQLLLLENLTYLIKDEAMESLDITFERYEAEERELTVGDVVQGTIVDDLKDNKEYGTYVTGEDWKKIFAAIQKDETLMNMKIITVAGDPGLAEGKERAEDSPQEGALSAVFVNEETGEAVVAFRGTAEYEWKDNFLGGAPTTDPIDGVSTQYQRSALEWYQGLGLANAGYTTITVIGHSKGGNKAKYIAILDTSVTRCISFDGQGFSDEFYGFYKREIAQRQYAITNYNVEYDYVNLLLNDVGETIYCQGYDYGEGRFLEAHCPNTFFWFDEEGHAGITPVDGQAAEMAELNKFLNSYLRTLTVEEKIATMDLIGELAEKLFKEELEGNFKSTVEEKNGSPNLLNLLKGAAGYAALHPQFTNAVKNVIDKFYSDVEKVKLIKYILFIIEAYTPIFDGREILSFFYTIFGTPTENVEDLQAASIYNPLEKNRVFSINKMTALGRQGKVLMNVGSVACMTWDDGIDSLKELVECLPGEARSTLLKNCLDGITEKFYKEEYETMGEYIYKTTTKIAEDMPEIDRKAAEEIDEITENLSARISAIKSLESSLNIKPVQKTWGIGGF